MTTLTIATRNAHKTREIRELLGQACKVRDLSTLPAMPVISEDGTTLAENATLKALGIARLVDGLILADDSGLEVDLLGGAPGVFSARYAGADATDQQNIEKLQKEWQNRSASGSDRPAARFRCVMVLARAGEFICAVEGVVEGTIVDPPRGLGGFGYDPVFQPVGYDRTFGELPAEIKNQISHRARAIEKVREFLLLA